jgi:hypothetical protein
MSLDVQGAIGQIDQVLGEYRDLASKSSHDDYSDQPEPEVTRVAVRLASAIDRLSVAGSHYKQQLQQINSIKEYQGFKINALVGTLSALKREYELGHFQAFAELIHADTAVSIIEMAEDLHRQGYKDAAAVIVGSLLEQHLRDLSVKNQITVQTGGKYKKAEALNVELAAQSIYSKLDQKNVTSWLGLRNEAAHGHYATYTKEQVRLMIDSVQDFMSRHSA